jgi:DNA-binding transcriptional regulator YiaG
MLSARDLREMRDLAGTTIPQAAKTIGVSVGCVWNFEHGKTKPTDEQLARLGTFYAKAIGKRLTRLWRLTGVTSN